jgi:hypothetical protein
MEKGTELKFSVAETTFYLEKGQVSVLCSMLLSSFMEQVWQKLNSFVY